MSKKIKKLLAAALNRLPKPPERPEKTAVDKTFNYNGGSIRVRFTNDSANEPDPNDPAEVMVYDSIGADPWNGGGITAGDFKRALDQIPKNKDLHIRVNSKGGDVHEGMTMMSLLNEWPNKITTTIDGIAASTASWAFIQPADEVRAPRGSQMFIHDALAQPFGNADQLRDYADQLDKTSDQIAGMYSEKSGKGKRTMRDLMKKETLLTGEEAKDMGLVDTLIDSKPVRNFAPGELTAMKNRLAAIYNSIRRPGDQPTQNVMNKKKIILILNAAGVTEWEGKAISEETADEHLEAALNSVLNKKKEEEKVAPRNQDIVDLRKQIDQLTEANNSAKKLRITNEIEQLINNDQLPLALKDKTVARAMKDEAYLEELKSLPAKPPGAQPLTANRLELTGERFTDVQNYLLENGPKFTRNFIGARADNSLGKQGLEEVRSRAIIVANTINKHKKMLIEMFNTNNIDAGLQRQIILQEMVEEFAIGLLPLQNFSTVFNNIPLEGTDEVDVPFYPLAADAGNSWNPATGYAGMGDTTTNTRKVLVGGSGTASGAAAPAGTCRDRKWVGAAFSSYELARQPYLNIQKLMIQKARRLAVLIFTDFVSRVICAANYGASIKAVPAAQFSGDDIADLWENATGRNWPDAGRALVLTHKYKTPLLKDPTFKQYLSYGATDPLRKAQIKEAYGFEDMPIVPNLDSYSPVNEFLVGWINHMSAALFATSPIMPTPEVRALMTRYDVIVHPQLGCAFEYRRFGDTTLDQTKEIVESSYGGSYAVQSALARLTSQ